MSLTKEDIIKGDEIDSSTMGIVEKFLKNFPPPTTRSARNLSEFPADSESPELSLAEMEKPKNSWSKWEFFIAIFSNMTPSNLKIQAFLGVFDIKIDVFTKLLLQWFPGDWYRGAN